MGHSSLEAGDASEIRVVCIGHLARVRSWLTASEGVELAPDARANDEADLALCGATGAPRPARTDAVQP